MLVVVWCLYALMLLLVLFWLADMMHDLTETDYRDVDRRVLVLPD